MKILSIETSCDETSTAVVKDGSEILSSVVASQIDFHRKYGGVVPEIASRKHIEVINPLIKQALDEAKIGFDGIDAVAVTYGPGLVGALLVGICAAKAIAYTKNIPLVGVNHIEGHIYANFISGNPKSEILNTKPALPAGRQIPNPKFEIPNFPFICLVVSGGHTMIVLVKDHLQYETLGRTRDDAAGEAFDKVARFLELGFPGGPIIDEMAKKGNPHAIEFTRPMLEDGYDFSFSGIKTAVVNYVKKFGKGKIEDLVASFQQAVVDVLVEKTLRAAREKGVSTVALAGGVSANSALRESLKKKAENSHIKVIIPPINLCTDNAAMIGAVAYYKLKKGQASSLDLAAVSSLRL